MATDTPTTASRIALVLVVLLAASAGAAPTAAQADTTQQSYLDRLLGLDDDQNPSTVGTMLAGIQGDVAGLTMGSPFSDPDPEAELDAMARWYNNNSEAWAGYANQQVNATGEHNVIKIVYRVGDRSETKFLILPIENGEYQPGTMQDSRALPGAESYVKIDEDTYVVKFADGRIEKRSRVEYEVDDTITVRGDAVGAVNADIKTMFRRYIAQGEDVSRPFAAKMARKYNGHINTTLVGGEQ